MKFSAFVSSDCWLSMEGLLAPLRVGAGDCFLLTRGTSFQLGTDHTYKPTGAENVFASLESGATAMLNGGDDFLLFGSRFVLNGEYDQFLLSSLPPLMHIRSSDRNDTLVWALQQLHKELREGHLGIHLAADHLAHLMLTEVLRQ
jgi:hypothetical protein